MAFHPNDTGTNHDDPCFRMYVPTDATEVYAVCVQWFDYFDYSGTFLPGWFDDRDEADVAAEQATAAWALGAEAVAAHPPDNLSRNPNTIEIAAIDAALVALDTNAPAGALVGVHQMRTSLERRRHTLTS